MSSYKLIIEDDEGRRSVVPVQLGEVTIGRNETNTIRLKERNVSRSHARLMQDGAAVFAEDLKSSNGVFVNGRRIKKPSRLYAGDLLSIGDFKLELRGKGLPERTPDITAQESEEDREPTQPGVWMRPPGMAPPPRSPTPVHEESTVADAGPAGMRDEATAIIRMPLEDRTGPSGDIQTIAGKTAKLVAVSKLFAGREFKIHKTEVVIGRTEDNDIVLDHRSVSRHHAKIVVAGDGFKAVDLNSANGLLVNGEPYAAVELKAGDLLEFGHVKMRFLPPGAVYSFDAAERAIIDEARGAARPSHVAVSHEKAVPTSLFASPQLWVMAGSGMLLLFVLLVMVFSGGEEATLPTVVEDELPLSGLQRVPPSAKELMDLAREAFTARHWDEAAQFARRALAADPDYPGATALLAQAELETRAKGSYEAGALAKDRNEWLKAKDILREIPEASYYYPQGVALVTQMQPAFINAHSVEVRSAINKGRFDAAEELLSEMADMAPDSPEIARLWEELVVAQGKANQPDTPTKPPPRKRPARVERRPPPPAKKAPAEVRVELVTNESADELLKEGTRALKAGEFSRAVEAFNRCIQLDRRNCMCYRAMGITYAREGNAAKAARYYRLYVKACPDAPDVPQVQQLLKEFDAQ